jgi:hypothetical protein
MRVAAINGPKTDFMLGLFTVFAASSEFMASANLCYLHD